MNWTGNINTQPKLVGSTNWHSGTPNATRAVIDHLKRHNHNCTRIWTWHSNILNYQVYPWTSTGHKNTLFFDNLHKIVDRFIEAEIYPVLMLFQGHDDLGTAIYRNWLTGQGRFERFHDFEKRLLDWYIEELDDFKEVGFEICNEVASTHWQRHIASYLQAHSNRPVFANVGTNTPTSPWSLKRETGAFYCSTSIIQALKEDYTDFQHAVCDSDHLGELLRSTHPPHFERAYLDAEENGYRVLWLMDSISKDLRLPGEKWVNRPWNWPENPGVVRAREVLGEILGNTGNGDPDPTEKLVIRLPKGTRFQITQNRAERMLEQLDADREKIRGVGELVMTDNQKKKLKKRLLEEDNN